MGDFSNYVSDGLINMYDGILNALNEHQDNPAIWKDLIGNNDGVLCYNGSADSAYWNANNWNEKSCVFNGSNYVRINKSVSDSFTLEVIFKTTQNNQSSGTNFWQGAGLVGDEVGGYVYDYGVSINSVGSICAGIGRKTSSSDYALNSQTGLNDGQYHSASLVRDKVNANLLLYADGKYVTSSSTHNNTLSDGSSIYIGAICENTNKYIGEISSVRIYNKALSASEIYSNYIIDKYRFMGKLTAYLLKDGESIKSYIDSNLEVVGTYPPDANIFEQYGMKKDTVNKAISDRNAFTDTKPKILCYTNEENAVIPKLYEKGTPYGEIVEEKNSIDFSDSYINHIKDINITATKGVNDILKFIISKDDGVTWLTFNGSEWVAVLKDKIDMLTNGMSLEVINSLTESQLIAISNTRKIKLAWYMKRYNLDGNILIKQIKLDYNTNL